jgi:hypothetical protein
MAPNAKITITTTITILSQGLEDFVTATGDGAAGGGVGGDAGDETG